MERFITIAQGKKIFIAQKRIGLDDHYTVIAEANNEVNAGKIMEALNAATSASAQTPTRRKG